MRSSRRRALGSAPALVATGVAIFSLLIAAHTARALPEGRAWARTESVSYPHIRGFGFSRFDLDGAGVPRLVVSIGWDTTAIRDVEWSAFTWKDSAWVSPIFARVPAGFSPEPALALTGGEYVLWLGLDPAGSGYGRLLLSEILPDRFTPPETVMVTPEWDSEYSAAVSARRRWVARSDALPFEDGLHIRVAYSDTFGVWHEFERQGIDEPMCSIAPLSDSSAMLAFAGQSGLAWVLFEGNRMARAGYLDSRPTAPLHPRFRFRPSGGLWLIWTERGGGWIHASSYDHGQWSRGDSLRCRHPEGQTFVSSWLDASRDTAERPILAWGDEGYAYTYRDVGCVAFPNDSGWDEGEEVPGSDDIFTTPTVTRDRNGDAWLAWNRLRQVGVWFTHTFVSATATAPHVVGAGRQRAVAWTLSEPAPESWWAVLRARGDGEFEPVARVRAGADPAMSWTDTTPPAGVLRYQIRRESVDKRYEWASEETVWPPRSNRPRPSLRIASPVMNSADVQLSGATAGALVLRVYDLQGRLVHEQGERASGLGTDLFRLDLEGAPRTISSGIYFVVARDARGVETAAAKFAVLR